jgi:hypothetical protein
VHAHQAGHLRAGGPGSRTLGSKDDVLTIERVCYGDNGGQKKTQRELTCMLHKALFMLRTDALRIKGQRGRAANAGQSRRGGRRGGTAGRAHLDALAAALVHDVVTLAQHTCGGTDANPARRLRREAQLAATAPWCTSQAQTAARLSCHAARRAAAHPSRCACR